MNLFKQIKKECKGTEYCDKCALLKDDTCLLDRPPCEWNKGEIKRAFKKEK